MSIVREVATKTGYNRWAPQYETDSNPMMALEESVLYPQVGKVRNMRVLDLGCGTGRHARRLAKLGARVVGLDFSEGMLDQARLQSEGLGIAYLRYDLQKRLPFVDNEFDMIVCSLVLEHVKDLAHVFKEMKRAVKPGGLILVSDMHPAMRLRGSQAHFYDVKSQEDIHPKGYVHSLSEYVLDIQEAGLLLEDMQETAGSKDLADEYPKMKKYLDWPMLVTFRLRKRKA